MRHLFLALPLLAMAYASHAQTPLPSEVKTFVQRRELCDHLRGEIPDEPTHADLRRINQACHGADKQLEQLKARYRDNANVRVLLNRYEPNIEAH